MDILAGVVADLKDELAALRIERAPRNRRIPLGGWVSALILVGAAGAGVWVWMFREKAPSCGGGGHGARTGGAGGAASVLNASGYVTARRRATVSSKVTGKVVEVNVEEGMAVERRPDPRAARRCRRRARRWRSPRRRPRPRGARVAENEVRLAEAKLDARPRGTQLLEGRRRPRRRSSIRRRPRWTRVEARLERRAAAGRRSPSARSTLQQTDLDDTIIRAPFSGVAISKDAQPGEMVSPVSAGGGFTRTGICTIVDMRSLEIEVDVNEAYINRVTPGQDVRGDARRLPGLADSRRTSSRPSRPPTARRRRCWCASRFEELDPRILPDMGVKVTFLREEPTATAGAGARPRVLRAEGRASRTRRRATASCSSCAASASSAAPSKIGGADGDRVEVLAGLAPASSVVVPCPPPADATATRVTRQSVASESSMSR